MSDEGFLKRWSRRKRTDIPPAAADSASVETPPTNLPPQTGEASSEVADGARIAPSPVERGKAGTGVTPQAPSASPKQDDDAIDPAALPPIESLGPDSDYTVFLKKGVPEALRNAALRKAWMSDPFIRDFRGPAEYALDYTTAEFDLRPTDDVAKMLDGIFPPRALADEKPPAVPEPLPEALAAPAASGATNPISELSLPQKEAVPAPAEPPLQPAANQPPAPRRKHGGALPDEPVDES